MRVDFKTGTFYLGDCLDVLAGTAFDVDIVLTDPPYRKTRNSWDHIIPIDELWVRLDANTKVSAPIVMTAQQPFTSRLVVSNMARLRHSWIWEKTEPSGHLNANRSPLIAHEDILVFCRDAPAYYPQKTHGHDRKTARRVGYSSNYGAQKMTSYDSTERFPRSVITMASDKQKGAWHPTQKPVALFEYLLRTYSMPAALVLDVAAGSGTTAIAAIQSGRRWICIERDPDYFNAAIARVWEAEQKLA